MTFPLDNINYDDLATEIKQWGEELGFQKIGICDTDLSSHQQALTDWIANGYHGDMAWLENNNDLRTDPQKLVEGTLRVISARMQYLPPNAQFLVDLKNRHHGYISRYALGRDYHKLMRKQLQKLAQKIEARIGTQIGYRPFVDSAPVLERPLAQKSGLGWVGKHSLLLNEESGSWFFLGELLVNLPLPIDKPIEPKCGNCRACMTSCPTQAIVAEGVVDARRCVSYLTIEYDGIIPLEFRKAIGNRIYGCDDCQLVCPYNRYSQLTEQEDFHRRNIFTNPTLVDLFTWDEKTFLSNTEGSAIRRIGHTKWRRNIAIAMGNAPYSAEIIAVLTGAIDQEQQKISPQASQSQSNQPNSEHANILVEHLLWALNEQKNKPPIAENSTQQDPALSPRENRLLRIIEKGLPRDA